ncbi:hypothetical protein pb186bvf_011768 [Paramecium bursaria]
MNSRVDEKKKAKQVKTLEETIMDQQLETLENSRLKQVFEHLVSQVPKQVKQPDSQDLKKRKKNFKEPEQEVPTFGIANIEAILEKVGYTPERDEIEQMIWEVDEDLDNRVSWYEFELMFKRCIYDQTGLEPRNLFNLTQFLMYCVNQHKYSITVEDTLELIYVRHKRQNLDEEIFKIFGSDEKTADGQEKAIDYKEYLSQMKKKDFNNRISGYTKRVIMTDKIIQTIYKLSKLEQQLHHKETLILLCLQVPPTQIPIDFQALMFEYMRNLEQDNHQLSVAYNLVYDKRMKLMVPEDQLIMYKIMVCKAIGILYKRMQKLQLSIQTLKYVIKLEQQLIKYNKYEMLEHIQTRLSLVAGLSKNQNHQVALNQLKLIQNLIENHQNDPKMKRLECIMYYNMGVEWEHLLEREHAVLNFEIALTISQNHKLEELEAMISKAIKLLK